MSLSDLILTMLFGQLTALYREHAMLAKTAGVRHLVVLINKMDDSTVNWSEERSASPAYLCVSCVHLCVYADHL